MAPLANTIENHEFSSWFAFSRYFARAPINLHFIMKKIDLALQTFFEVWHRERQDRQDKHLGETLQ